MMKHTKRFLAILLSALLLVSSLPLAAFAAGPESYKSVEQVDVVDVTAPEGGQRLDYNWNVAANTIYGKSADEGGVSCFWIKKSSYEDTLDEWISKGEIYREGIDASPYIERGYYYVFCARLKCSGGYAFSAATVATINGEPANIEPVGNGEVIVWRPFYAHDIVIDSVEIYHVKTPVAGETITYDYGFEEGQIAYDYSRNDVGMNSYWAVTDKAPTSWNEIDEADGYVSNDPETYTFEAGKYYTFVARVNSNFGYSISNAAKARMNGEEAMIRFMAPHYEIARTFYVPKKETPVVPPVIDKPGAKTSATLYINKTNYLLDGKTKVSDSAPVIVNSRTFVPFRLIAEVFGADVKWNAADQSITTTLGDTTVGMQIGHVTYTINSLAGVMDVAPYINKANRTLVPLRFMAEALGCTVTPYYAADGTTERVVFEK